MVDDVSDCNQLRIATSGCMTTFEALTLYQSVSEYLRLDITVLTGYSTPPPCVNTLRRREKPIFKWFSLAWMLQTEIIVRSYDVTLDVTSTPVHRIKSNLGRPADLAASVDNLYRVWMEAQHPEVANNTWQGPGGPDTPRVGEYLCFSPAIFSNKIVTRVNFRNCHIAV